MRVSCLHGYFMFREDTPGEISKFMYLSGFSLVPKDDYFTFEALAEAPDYSIIGSLYLGVPCIKTFEGSPWEVMNKNDLVFDFTLDEIVPILSITEIIQVTQGSSYFFSNGMIVPGSITDDGLRVTDYSAFYNFDQGQFKYSEVTYV